MPDPSPLLERDGVLASLRAAWTDAAAARGSVHLLQGPAGIGKTTVIEAFVRSLEPDARRVLHARCSPLSATVPGSVVRAWFAPLLRTVPLGSAPFDGPAVVLSDASAPPLELAYAVQWAVEDLTTDGPVLAVVDDVHWSDPVSLAVLDHLTAAIAGQPVVVLLGRRSAEPVTAPEHLARVARRARRHPLPPLSAAAAARLVAHLPAEAAAEVVRRSEGVPLFVRELSEAHGSGETGTPRGVVDVVRSTLARLPEGSLDIARVVALAARPVTAAVVAAVARRPAAEALRLLDGLAEADVVVWEEAEPPAAAVGHALIGDAILDDLGPAGRAELHADLAAVLRRQGAADDEVAGHLLHTLPSGRREARDLLLAAGRRALVAGAAELASRYLLRAVDELADPPHSELLPILQEAARALAGFGAVDQALTAWRRAAASASSAAEAALVMAEAGDALTAAGRHQEALDLWRTWLERTPPEATEERKVLMVRVAMNALTLSATPGEFEAELRRVSAQPAHADTHGDRLLLAAAAAGLVFQRGETADRAAQLAVRAWGGGRLLDEASAVGAPVYVVSGVLTWTDTLDVALDVLDRAVADARELRSALGLATALFCRGCALLRSGAVTGALDDLTLADDLRRFGWSAYTPVLLQMTVAAHLARGDVASAAALGPALEECTREPGSLAEFAAVALADLALVEGRADDAARLVEEVAGVLGAADNPAMLSPRRRLARARLLQGRVDEARAAAAEDVRLARGWGAPRAAAEALTFAAEVGAGDEPEALLREALALLERPALRRTVERTAAEVALAELLVRRDRSVAAEEAAALARSAHTRASAEGLAPLVARSGAILSGLGAGPGPVGDRRASLTPAERRVVDLVLAGRTNRQVAEELFVTVKAVEWHLSSVYRKLGIRGRRDLAAVVPGS
ncbi:AAA family ATPase [Nocardioides sp. SYSU DS0651]|uniref:AAA family ATPase n=1 Tax=Nocardioides sp. SYSU DS0651 TaxID=3415955 RepID=UPI003F4CA2AA